MGMSSSLESYCRGMLGISEDDFVLNLAQFFEAAAWGFILISFQQYVQDHDTPSIVGYECSCGKILKTIVLKMQTLLALAGKHVNVITQYLCMQFCITEVKSWCFYKRLHDTLLISYIW